MAQDSDTGEKTEEPTGKKLGEAVSKGNIAKSADINTAALLAVTLLLLSMMGSVVWEAMQSYLIHIFRDLGELQVSSGSVRRYLVEFFKIAGTSILPFMLGVMFFGTLAAGTQTKFQLTAGAVSWNLNKFNPINGLKRIFSWKSWGEFLINFIKLSVVVALVCDVVWGVMWHPVFHHPSYLEQVLAFIVDAGFSLLKKVLLAMIVIGAVDYAYQWWRTREEQLAVLGLDAEGVCRSVRGLFSAQAVK